MWETTVDNRKLNFRLAGINNQNFIMRDEETGTWWQQVTGEAILGPLKGRRLKSMAHDELSFGLWKREKPHGRVLRPDEEIQRAGKYAPADWEDQVAKMPVAAALNTDATLEPRTLIVGVTAGGASKAYPFSALLRQSPVLDTVGGTPIVVILGDDKKSVRAYERQVGNRKLEFFVKSDASPLQLIDAETGSTWDFTGRATDGALAGQQLNKIPVLNDYWFDWRAYHPNTTVYQLGER